MFERRLKILLISIIGFAALLAARAGYLQIVQGSEYAKRAIESGRRFTNVETFRGQILDVRGRVVATDAPCTDACVDYRAINPDAAESQKWLREVAVKRLVARGALKGVDKERRATLVEGEYLAVRKDLAGMWTTLAELSGRTTDDVEEVRQGIVRRVEMRRRYVWYKRFDEAKAKHAAQPPAGGWYSWLIDDSQQAPQLDSFKVTVSEQTEPHVVLRAVDNDVYVKLDALRERWPWLELKKSTHRHYPFADVGCHVIGTVGQVLRDDLEKNPHVQAAQADDARRYFYNDVIGRGGIERLCEPELRGSRGQIVKQLGREGAVDQTPPTPGRDVRITIDMDLQMRIQEAFLRYKEQDDPAKPGQDLRVRRMPVHEMHGAAVVIDVSTGQVRAMVSYPTFDLNQYDQLYPKLSKDVINLPLMNRATQAALEPGSTVKPLVGLAAITQGVLQVAETIECTGYLVIDGRPIKQGGKCWVASKFAHLVASVAHHQIPTNAPHPTGFLTFADALERSCNVFFELSAHRLGLERLGQWYKQFGLGQMTEIGLPESKGRVPGDFAVPNPASATWFSGIGQSQVLATPLQMANAVATIARGGIFIRPHLRASETPLIEPRDLRLSPEALAMARAGMIGVVNNPAGTGRILRRDDIVIAGKTGTAQAAVFNIVVRDSAGKIVRDEAGKIKRQFFKPSTPEEPNEQMPWYRGSGNSGTELGHAWFVGYAPAHDPKIAFAVMVEYGGSGGKDAGPVAQAILEACIEHGYLPVTRK
ncbi:MAG TPA: penicillin-binding transpeptidase domain-containing protein [Tepidisphaeraceae bacterium]|nr:penicillin-binding transpeptidase domain-containing protein [Tepidisphaeraceae bacterium]